jgi:hypothetical protein
MSKVTFIKKEHLGSGNFEYTYKCECNNSSNEIKVVSGNNNSALALAELECDELCDEKKGNISEYHQTLKSLLQSERPDTLFSTWVEDVSADFISVKLCTGQTVQLPCSIINNFKLLGISQSEEKITKLGLISIDKSSPEGLAIYQLCEIVKNYHDEKSESLQSKLFSEESLTITVPISGLACNHPSYSYFNSQYPIIDFATNRSENCSVVEVKKLGNKQLRVQHAAFSGTPCGNNYSGKVYIDIVIQKP